MPRISRSLAVGYAYHALNRGNERQTVFHDAHDYDAFSRRIGEACRRYPVDVYSYVLMPNHFHFVLAPREHGAMSRWMHWLTTSHVGYHRTKYRTTGHIWQGRFKSFPIQRDDHLLTVLRYVAQNPLRARLVARAENWPWSSLNRRVCGSPPDWLTPPPVALPTRWHEVVNDDRRRPPARLLCSLAKGSPFGTAEWTQTTAEALGLEFTLRSRGRPRKTAAPKRQELAQRDSRDPHDRPARGSSSRT